MGAASPAAGNFTRFRCPNGRSDIKDKGPKSNAGFATHASDNASPNSRKATFSSVLTKTLGNTDKTCASSRLQPPGRAGARRAECCESERADGRKRATASEGEREREGVGVGEGGREDTREEMEHEDTHTHMPATYS